jgi:RNA polymerase sigma-70 factor (ECF subfamily)
VLHTVTRASDNVNVIRIGGPFTDDQVLVAALRRGDEDAFAWLIDRYNGSLRRLARTYVSTAAVADDVVADTWLAVVKGIDRFEGRSAVSTWLYRILANIARTRGVREHRTIPFSSAAGAMEDGAGPAVEPERFGVPGDPGYGQWASMPTPWNDEPEASLESRETLAAVRAAVEALPPAQREVITLRDLEGWTSTEVRNALDLSETNQRVLLHRARAKVRRALEQHFEEAGG